MEYIDYNSNLTDLLSCDVLQSPYGAVRQEQTAGVGLGTDVTGRNSDPGQTTENGPR